MDALPAPNVKDEAGKPRAIDAANADARALVPAPVGSVTLEQRAVILATAGPSSLCSFTLILDQSRRTLTTSRERKAGPRTSSSRCSCSRAEAAAKRQKPAQRMRQPAA